MSELPAAAFPPATQAQWRALVDAALKGAAFEKRLVSRTHDGLAIQPLYPKAEPAPQPGRAAPGPWRVAQRIDHPDPAEANGLALADLEGGADALVLVFDGAPAARGFGLRADDVAALDRALQGVLLDLIHLRLDAGGRGRQAAALLVALAERRGHRLGDLAIDLALDPIGAMAATGRLSAPWPGVAARCAGTVGDLAARGFRGRTLLADARPYHEAGASEAIELAAVLATGVAYLRALEAGGHDLAAARDALAFLLVADADQFLAIAKMRALRRLWARVEAASGLAPKPIRLHAETAWRMATRRDPWVNMLRATAAAFSAGLGGADSVAVLPFTAALGLPDAFARRVARNTQIILLEEAHLGRVADPAAGSGGLEALTEALSEAAWSAFQAIEGEGGIVDSLAAGALQARIAAVQAQRRRAAATRREPITGTSEFPDLNEAPVSVLLDAAPPRSPRAEAPPSPPDFAGMVDAAAAGAPLGALVPAAGDGAVEITALPSARLAEGFERLRDRSDAVLAAAGRRPSVFLANLGPPAAFTARATFAKNLFESGGIEAEMNDGATTIEALLDLYRASNAKLACLCSSDEIYDRMAVEAARALKEAGCDHIYLARRLAEAADDLQAAGVNDYIFAGCDALGTLERAHAQASLP